MPNLTFRCSSCGDRIVTDESRAGSVYACPSCAASAAVPFPGEIGEFLSVDLRFRCTACQSKLAIDAEHAGITTRCPKCNRPITVPALPSALQAPSPVPLNSPSTPAAAILSQDEVAFLMQK